MRDNLKATVRGYYDTQMLRMQIGGRVIANFKAALGQEPGEREETLEEVERASLIKLRREYKKITDGVVRFPTRKGFKGTRLISHYTELIMVANYNDLLKVEERLYKEVGYLLEGFEIYNQFLKLVKGCGIAMSAVILSEMDIHKARYPSSLWKYAGIDVAEDGKGRSRRKEHLIKKKYINKKGIESERNSITFNPWVKTKLLGVLGPSFLKQRNEPYSEIYYQYKHRLEHHAIYKDVSKGHRHNMAIRYMIKRFLVDLHIAWREVEGLPPTDEYATAKLGIMHKAA
jgi:hypothetical protein